MLFVNCKLFVIVTFILLFKLIGQFFNCFTHKFYLFDKFSLNFPFVTKVVYYYFILFKGIEFIEYNGQLPNIRTEINLKVRINFLSLKIAEQHNVKVGV